ncbi:pilus assembly protein PilZ [Candidatus Pelagibacter sp.]|nr:pilus assembly protein PilZ [Candidatus Pelagibacter sp.]
MNKKNQKGFTLILSLVLLLVMSLMGGSLIVISSSDHQSNNTSDEYQQTFYVAEHALIEAEKYVINQMIGPWVDPATLTSPGAGATAEELQAHKDYVSQLKSLASSNGGFARHTDASTPWPNGRGIPTNIINVSSTPCSNSFRNLIKDGDDNTLVAVHQTLWNFGELIEPILNAESAPDKEIEHMKRYGWEFFVINVGRSTFKGAGTSLKKTSTNAQQQGNAYKLYGCGYLMPKGSALTDIDDPEILIPLETLVILSG